MRVILTLVFLAFAGTGWAQTSLFSGAPSVSGPLDGAVEISFVTVSSTNTTQPPAINIDLSGAAFPPVAGDEILWNIDGASYGTQTVTSNNIADGDFPSASSSIAGLGDGSYPLKIQWRRGAQVTGYSNTLTFLKDGTAPTLSNPVASAINALNAQGSVDTNDTTGTAYWVIVPTAATAPSGLQVIACEDGAGNPAVNCASQAVSGTTITVPVISGLSGATAYKVYYTQRDPAGNVATPVNASVTTPTLFWTLVAHVKTQTATPGAATATTPAFDSTGSNLITCQLTQYDGGGANATLSDSASNGYTAITTTRQHPSGYYSEILYVISPSTSATHTITVTKAQSIVSLTCQAWTKTSGTPVFDVTAGATCASAGTSCASGSVTPTADNALIVSSLGAPPANAAPSTVGMNLADLQLGASGLGFGVAGGYYPQSTAAIINPTWVFSSAGNTSAISAVFK